MIRVREVLRHADCSASLRGKLPTGVTTVPEYPKSTYPLPILKLFDTADKYPYLGLVTEYLLRETIINRDALERVLCRLTHNLLPDNANVDKFLDKVNNTKKQMLQLIHEPLQYETVVGGKGIEGHPDARTTTDLFEVKTSGHLTDQWTQFLLQLFCYGALDAKATRVHLVLPLQEAIWSYDLTNWSKRQLFKTVLEESVAKLKRPDLINMLIISMTFAFYPIGSHIPKKGKLINTLGLVVDHDPAIPWQMFLGGPTTTYVQIKDQELAECQQLITSHHLKVFIHASYIINLCAMNEYNVSYLTTVLGYAKSMGARGVVVHVGKRCKLNEEDAMNNMTANIMEIIEVASPSCPLLIETPAGQGTEILSEGPETFNNYCAMFDDPRLGTCIDTCHVFATGVKPSNYLKTTLEHPEWKKLLKLIHFNDSARPLGSRIDRHEVRGFGHIGAEDLQIVAEWATQAGVSLVCE